MSETDQDVLETLQVLQYTRLLMPASLSGTTSAAEKLRAYKNKAQCLSDFSDWYLRKDDDTEVKAKYDFTVQFAPQAIKEFEHWQAHFELERPTKSGKLPRRVAELCGATARDRSTGYRLGLSFLL